LSFLAAGETRGEGVDIGGHRNGSRSIGDRPGNPNKAGHGMSEGVWYMGSEGVGGSEMRRGP